MNAVQDAYDIINASIDSVLPDNAVKKALTELPDFAGRLILVAIGKAAWQMAWAAYSVLGEKIDDGIVITKYSHAKGPIGSLKIRQAGHPVPDENTYSATQEAMDLVSPLDEGDLVLFLVSGGGSALFEKSLLPNDEIEEVTRTLLSSGADISQINMLRKRFSAVKGGKFAKLCSPAKVFSVLLSDVLGDAPDVIASGPAYPDSSTCDEARAVAKKYNLKLSDDALTLLNTETPKNLDNVQTFITGSVRQLCSAAVTECRRLGYETFFLTADLCCQAKEAGGFMASIAKTYKDTDHSVAFIAGGETVVRLTGKGLGGRNQELALAAAKGIRGIENCVVFSVGSDGTDGPTDSAGGICTGESFDELKNMGIDVDSVLLDNDSYNALKAVDGLIITGPTGTNVNDVCGILIKR